VNFEEEYKALWAWYDQRCNLYFEALRRGDRNGLDSEHDGWHKKDTKEFNRRLILLKVKYGRELDEGDKELYDRIKNQSAADMP
jgi:hypothetical protein